jgi:beta-1,2-mannobiose phosphorylase / 1,2-beta-oligomannan phosphorylase
MNNMTKKQPLRENLAERFNANPVLKPGDIRPSVAGLRVECLLNPGVFRFKGKIWLLLRVAERPEQKQGVTSFPVLDKGKLRIHEFSNDDARLDLKDPRVVNFEGADYLTTLSHLQLAGSEDGIHFQVEPLFKPLIGEGEYESYGIEDCRVSQIGPDYYLTYTAVSPNGVAVGLRSTRDWQNFTRHGLIFPPHNKDCALFEEKIDGNYFALHRPSSPELGGNYIWLSESSDLLHWGGHRCLARTRPGMWDSVRVGAGAAPIRTSAGWLEIYHGADENHRYCLGALLLDLNKPWKVLARSNNPIMEPVAQYERTGFFGNVVFTNGQLVDGDQLTIYYGASDSVICGAKFSITDILKTLTLL